MNVRARAKRVRKRKKIRRKEQCLKRKKNIMEELWNGGVQLVHALKDKIILYTHFCSGCGNWQRSTTTLAVLIFDFSLVIFYNICFHFARLNGFHFHILQFKQHKRAEQKLHFIFFFKSRPCVYIHILAKQTKQYAVLKKATCWWLSFTRCF